MGIKDTQLFRRWAKKAFDEIGTSIAGNCTNAPDIDKTGQVDYKEVYIGILKIYDSLNAKFPAHVLAPKRQAVFDLCRKYDKDETGNIEFEEFLEMAKVLVGSRANFRESLLWKYGSVLMLKLVICPLAAVWIIKLLLHFSTPYADKVPAAPVASLIEIGVMMATKD